MQNKKFKKITAILFILCPIIAISYIYLSIPSKITSFSHENVAGQKFFLPILTTSPASLKDNDAINNYTLSFRLFNSIPIKDADVEVMPKIYVIPSGKPIGVKMYTDGVLIVGISYVTDSSGKNIYPARDAKIHEGDIIKKINGEEIHSIEEMTECINNSDGSLDITIERGRTLYDVNASACRSRDDGSYRLGIWVRDTAAGVGTMTFYNPETKSFASLGHAITDIDTGDVLKLDHGEIISCDIISVNKGSRGEPGELIGTFTNDSIGDIFINDPLGVYGKISSDFSADYEPIPIATRFEIRTGAAQILADVDGEGVKSYDIEIIHSAKDNSQNNKGIIFKVTDEDLIRKTGGIVQGMSGCPIIQNNMLIGAVTHVFINDPTKGYGIFSENMIDTISLMEAA